MISNLRTRFSLLILTTLIYGSGVGYLIYQEFQSHSQWVDDSIAGIQVLDKIQTLSAQNYDSTTFARLQEQRGQLRQEERQLALSAVLQAYAKRSVQGLQKSVKHFLRVEAAYQVYVQSQLAYHEENLRYLGSILLSGILALALFSYFLLRWTLFRPLNQLHQRMGDFLNNRYSYQFGVPSDNEVGRLHATFNAMAQQFIANMEELKSLDQAKSHFLSIASHELRTPLTSIKGSLGLLKGGAAGPLNEQVGHLIGVAEQETDRLIRLINDLLDLAKIEAKHFPLEKTWFAVDELLQSTLKGLAGLAQQSQVSFDVMLSASFEVHADKDRVQQVLTNLLSNAVKYSPSQGVVRLEVHVNENNQLLLAVYDQGPGISPEDKEMIFEKFQQATAAKTPLVKGTGLGLAIAKALVAEHNGEIGVRSIAGEGSCFFFSLPEWRSIEKLPQPKSDQVEVLEQEAA